MPFNVAGLQAIVAAAVHRDVGDIKNLRKLAEGGFNRAFEITMSDGLQVVARLPYPSTFPKRLCVASEVATMDLVRSHGVPVPKVLDYATTRHNAIGSEYIIMEKVKGRDLGQTWYKLTEKERLQVTIQITKLESLLFSITLPGYGSIYHKRDLDSSSPVIEIPTEGNAEQLCLGPDVDQKWWFNQRDRLSVSRGPCESLDVARPYLAVSQLLTWLIVSNAEDVLRADAIRELEWIQRYARPRMQFELAHSELNDYQKVAPAEHVDSLHKYLKLVPSIMPAVSGEQYLLRPTLRHPDLKPNNILVAEDFTITALIDWQHCSVLPLLLVGGIPEYWQNYGHEESHSFKHRSFRKT